MIKSFGSLNPLANFFWLWGLGFFSMSKIEVMSTCSSHSHCRLTDLYWIWKVWYVQYCVHLKICGLFQNISQVEIAHFLYINSMWQLIWLLKHFKLYPIVFQYIDGFYVISLEVLVKKLWQFYLSRSKPNTHTKKIRSFAAFLENFVSLI